MFKRKLSRLIKKVYPEFGLRDSDIILASYPKSGNTWFRFIWLNMVSLIELEGKEIDFHAIHGELNAEYDSHSYGETDYKSLPRIVKTHMQFYSRFSKYKSIYLVRNPGDVMVSYFKYRQALRGSKNNEEELSDFIRSPEYGIKAWCSHVKSWSDNASLIIKYESLKKNTFKQIKTALNKLNLNKKIDDNIVRESIYRSSFDQMRKVEVEKGRPNMERNFDQNYKFTRSGTVGEWEKEFQKDDIKLIRSMLKEYELNSFYNI